MIRNLLAATTFALCNFSRITATAASNHCLDVRPTEMAETAPESHRRFSIDDMACAFFEQPLNHFDLPRMQSGTFKQRYCVYDGFIKNQSSFPVFFYTGNESPVEQYVNQTGLIWETAPKFGAQIIFVEHRYEGKSLPEASIPNCMAYASSVQALADFANFIERYIFVDAHDISVMKRRPVIAFGGSYGGMLSAWLRNMYPNTVAGAIAASAPTMGFPRIDPTKIDAAYRVIQHGLRQSYPPMQPPTPDNYCDVNLKMAWPLIRALGRQTAGRELLTKSFRLCQPLAESDSDDLIRWAQSPWFDMAEGSFPYPSSYIPFALLHKLVDLPAWPVQAACWTDSHLHKDWGVSVTGNVTDVLFTVEYGESALKLEVDWDNVTVLEWPVDNVQLSSLDDLLSSVRDAVSVWFNITKDQECYDLRAAPNSGLAKRQQGYTYRSTVTSRLLSGADPEEQCRNAMTKGSWGAICCNEEMNLIITEAQGLGYDCMWPPSHPRGTKNHGDVLRYENQNPQELYCSDPDSIFGYPKGRPDPWATSFDTIYGGTAAFQYQSNIVYSNGLLDPWSAAGVYEEHANSTPSNRYDRRDGLQVQDLGRGSAAVLMKYGGHHTDLMYSNKADPPCVRGAREVEVCYLERWINEFWATAYHD